MSNTEPVVAEFAHHPTCSRRTTPCSCRSDSAPEAQTEREVSAGDEPELLLPEFALADLKLWMRSSLEKQLKYRSTTRSDSPVGEGYSYIEVPEWEMRQKQDLLDHAIRGVSDLLNTRTRASAPSPATTDARERALNTALRRMGELRLDEGFSSHYQNGFEMFRTKATAVIKSLIVNASALSSTPSQLRQNPRVNALLVALRKIRDNTETLDVAKETALCAIENYVDNTASTPTDEVKQKSAGGGGRGYE